VLTLPVFCLVGMLVTLATAAPTSSDQVTANGTLLWQGRPFFPIGIYNANHTAAEYQALAANGFNMIQGKFPGKLETFMNSLDLALASNIAVDVPLYISDQVRENLPNSLRALNAGAKHPAVLDWKILDEPDAESHTPVRDQVPNAYLTLKAAHPNQLFELTLSQADSLGYWVKYCDIVQIDRYPVPSRPLTDVYDFCRKAKNAKAPWQPLIFVVQCGWTSDLKTQPTYSQARAMVYLAIIGGAKGISWYSRQETDQAGNVVWDLTTSPLWPRLKEINSEIQALALPILLGEEVVGISSGLSGVYAAGKRWQDKLYLLVSNPGEASVAAVFTLPPGMRPHSVRAVGLSGRPTLDGGNLRVPLGPIDSGAVICDIAAPSS
jgi:hypothetical protein